MARKTQTKPAATTYTIGAQTTMPQAPLTATGKALVAPATPVAPQAQTAQQGPVLAVVAHATVRPGTAAAACWATLVAMQGQPRQAVLEGLKQAETAWHAENGRSVKGVAPSGWLRKFGTNIAWQ